MTRFNAQRYRGGLGGINFLHDLTGGIGLIHLFVIIAVGAVIITVLPYVLLTLGISAIVLAPVYLLGRRRLRKEAARQDIEP